jgi:signal peptidase I
MYNNIPTSKKISKTIITILFLLIVIAIAFVIIFRVTPFRIVGHSMSPTLTNSELVLGMNSKKLSRGDIIAFKNNEGQAIKRIIGLPGETVYIKDNGEITINGNPIKEEYISKEELFKGDVETSNPYTLKDDEYYVLGDNRKDSKDSRYIKVGAIKKEDIQSKIYFSISKLHSIE